jgi:glycosyltransferase involved in cell wall biosynthesis
MFEVLPASSCPQVSVVVPLYNKGAYIQRCLDSITAQIFQDFEIIVVDDGSTDEGPDIVSKYGDSRLRLVRQPNMGPGAARNRGMRESSGGLIAFLDADDEWLPGFLETCVTVLRANPDCALAITAWYEGVNRKKMLRRGIVEGTWAVGTNTSAKELRLVVDSFNSSMVLARREIVHKYGGFYSNKHCTYGEDTYLWLQVLLNHKVYRVLQPLVWFHVEASELGRWRKLRPLKAVLTDPGPLHENCPRQYVGLLDAYLNLYLLLSACGRARHGDLDGARALLKQFPAHKKLSWGYFVAGAYVALTPLLRILLSSPILFRCAHKIKNLLSYRL